jgi:hypothetical protein
MIIKSTSPLTLAICSAVACTTIARGAVTYVDATFANTDIATGGSDTLWADGNDGSTGGSVVDGAANNDGKWRFRSGIGNGGIWEATGSSAAVEDCVELATAVAVPNDTYEVYVFYYMVEASGDFPIRAGFESAPNSNAIFNRSSGQDASGLTFEVPPPAGGETRTLLYALVGQVEVTNGMLKVYIDDFPASTTGLSKDPSNIGPGDTAEDKDDHNTAAFLKLPDGRYLSAWSSHSENNQIHFRRSTHPGDATSWEPEQIYERSVADGASGPNDVTCNTVMLSGSLDEGTPMTSLWPRDLEFDSVGKLAATWRGYANGSSADVRQYYGRWYFNADNKGWDCTLVAWLDRGDEASDPLLSYTDADLSNTTLADGSALTTHTTGTGPGADDNQWHFRTDPSFGNNGTLFTANESVPYAEDCPVLKTTIPGVGPGTYDVFACFWSPRTNDYDLMAGLGENAPAFFERHGSQHAPAFEFDTAVRDADASRHLYRGFIGRVTLNASGPVEVFIDQLANVADANHRTWYDGIALQRVGNAGTDSDGDGRSDADEVVSGTDLFDANSYFTISMIGQTGPNLEPGYFAYTAPHESNSIDDPAGIDFTVFGTNVNLAVDYTDDSGFVNYPVTVKQMIGRGNSQVGAYNGTLPELMRDWVGIDSRASAGGNGPLGNAFGSPTLMTFTLTWLPAGEYQYRAYHHDAASIRGHFDLTVTDATRTNATLGSFQMSSSLPTGGNPVFDTTGNKGTAGVDAATLTFAAGQEPPAGSEFRTLFAANIGQTVVSGGQLHVYLDDFPASVTGSSNDRTWLQGIGYKPASGSEIRYVDVTLLNTDIVGGGPDSQWADGDDGSTGGTVTDGSALEDGLWRFRSEQGNGGIWEATGSTAEVEDCVQIVTTAAVPNDTYDVYVFYYPVTATGDYPVRAGFTSPTLTPGTNPGSGNPPSQLASTVTVPFTSNGDPVVFTYRVYEQPGDESLSVVGVNGFEIQTSLNDLGFDEGASKLSSSKITFLKDWIFPGFHGMSLMRTLICSLRVRRSRRGRPLPSGRVRPLVLSSSRWAVMILRSLGGWLT